MVVGGIVWAVDYYAGCQRAPEGRPCAVAYTVEEGAPGHGRGRRSGRERGVISCGGFVGNLLLRGTGKADEIRRGRLPTRDRHDPRRGHDDPHHRPRRVPHGRAHGPRPAIGSPRSPTRSQEALGIPAATFLTRADTGTFDRARRSCPPTPAWKGSCSPRPIASRRRRPPTTVIQRLLDAVHRPRPRTCRGTDAEALGVTPYEVVIVASMIEKEAGVQTGPAADRGRHHNRLADGMTLGHRRHARSTTTPRPTASCRPRTSRPTAPTTHGSARGCLLRRSRAPTCGRCERRSHPADTPYFYYVLCGDDGSHRFAVTYDEHLATSMSASAEPAACPRCTAARASSV